MVDSNQLKQVKEIIANLKDQNENKELAKQNKNLLKSTTKTDPKCARKDIAIASNISQEYCDHVQQETRKESSSNKNEDIRNIINNLRANKKSNVAEYFIFSDKIVSSNNTLKIGPNTTSFTNSDKKRTDENCLNNSGEIIRKLNPNYLQKPNNKRFKLNDTSSNKQSHLTEFYSVVKSTDNRENESKSSSEHYSKHSLLLNCETVTNKSKNQPEESIGNLYVKNDKTSGFQIPREKKYTHSSEISNSQSKESRVWDLFNSIKKRNEGKVFTNSNIIRDKTAIEKKPNFNVNIKKTRHLKEATNKYKKTLDDFCNNIIRGTVNKFEDKDITSENSFDLVCGRNNFLKSVSTGSIIPEKENRKDTNSVPITNCEIKGVEKRLAGNTTFEDFIEKILKKVKNGNSQNVKSSILNSKIDDSHNENDLKVRSEINISNNSEKSRNEEIIISLLSESNGCNKISQTSQCREKLHNFGFQTSHGLVEKSSNLGFQIIFPDQGFIKTDDFGKDPSNKDELTKTINEQITPINLCNKQKSNSNFHTSDILTENENMNSSSTTNFLKYSEDKKDKIKHNYMKRDAQKNIFNKNNLEMPPNEEIITSVMSQLGNHKKKLQTVQCREKSSNSHFGAPNSKSIYLSSEIDFSEGNLGSYHQKRVDCESTYRDSEIYSQFTQKYVDSEKNENSNQGNKLHLGSEKKNNLMNEKSLAFEKETDIEDFYNCVNTSCSQNKMNLENSFEAQINLLDNNLEKSILTTTFRKTQNIERNKEISRSVQLENFLKNIIPSTENKEYKNNVPDKCKLQVKRYKKGKTKIYRLKKLKKKHLETEEVDNEELNFHDILEKITTENYETQPRLSRFKSSSSISTSSSYITDDTKSDVLSTGSKDLTSPEQRLRTGFNELSKDKSLCYSRSEWDDVPEQDKEDIKMKIQDIFFQILEDFKNKKTSRLSHRRQSFENCVFKDGRLQLKSLQESSLTIISSGAQRSKAKFQLMLYILKKIQMLLETDTKLTKRELYYQLKELISDQRVSDRAINAISCLLDVGMWALNITAQKGLVFGNLKLLLSSGEMLNCNIPGTLIPQDVNSIVEVHSSAYFILVVEKESIFHKLIEEDLPNKLTRPFIMITGKGFPDLNTQLFLRKLWMIMSIPVFILVDADPHGINIMLNYRFGSVNNAHVSQHLAVPNAKWLGVYPSEIMNLNIARQPLNEKEIKLVSHILETPYMEFSPKLVDELKVLLTKKYKAGIEGLIKTDRYLSKVYLPNKFFTHNFI